MIYGYARCSTNEKLQDINRQVRELKQRGAIETTIYLEYESGAKEDRAELNKLLNVLQPQDTHRSNRGQQNYPKYKTAL